MYRIEGVEDLQVLGNQWVKFTVESGVVWLTVESHSMPSNHECTELPPDLTILGGEIFRTACSHPPQRQDCSRRNLSLGLTGATRIPARILGQGSGLYPQ